MSLLLEYVSAPFSEFPHDGERHRKVRFTWFTGKGATTHVFVWSELSKSLPFGCVDRIPRVPIAQAVIEN